MQLRVSLVCILLALAALAAQAQTWPARPIRLVKESGAKAD